MWSIMELTTQLISKDRWSFSLNYSEPVRLWRQRRSGVRRTLSRR